MAIGSEGEIGAYFGLWKDMSDEQRKAWWQYMRDNWHPYLMNGYATLVHNKDNPYYQQGPRWNNGKQK